MRTSGSELCSIVPPKLDPNLRMDVTLLQHAPFSPVQQQVHGDITPITKWDEIYLINFAVTIEQTTC